MSYLADDFRAHVDPGVRELDRCIVRHCAGHPAHPLDRPTAGAPQTAPV